MGQELNGNDAHEPGALGDWVKQSLNNSQPSVVAVAKAAIAWFDRDNETAHKATDLG